MNLHTLSEFNRSPRKYVQRLKRTGKPETLTIRDQAEVVVQSAEAYQKLLDNADLSKTLPLLQKSLEQAWRGEGRPARTVLNELADEAGIGLKR